MFTNVLHFSTWINRHFFGTQKEKRVFLTHNPKLLWKQHRSHLPDLERVYLLNELTILKRLARIRKKEFSHFTVSTPIVKEEHLTPSEISFASEFFEGQKLAKETVNKQQLALSAIFDYLANLQQTDSLRTSSKLGIRDQWSILLSGIIYGCMATVRRPALALQTLRATAQFVRLYIPVAISSPTLGIVHRDLDPDNIRIAKKEILLTDWENAVTSDQMFDLAQVPRLYGRHWGWDNTIAFCLERLSTQQAQNHWRALALYGILQAISIKPRETHMFASAQTGLHTFVPAKSAFEYAFFSLLACISFINRFLPSALTKTTKGMILCYHSIGYDNWRFTTRPQQFKEHLEFLCKSFDVTSLDDLLRTGKGIAITFDDGYQNVFTNAFPILQQLNKPATVFMIGNSKDVNRLELDNSLPLMTETELSGLQNSGWILGYHTQTHADLAHLPARALTQEIRSSYTHVRDRFNMPFSYFAYPRGYYSESVLSEVEKAGFKAAFTINSGYLDLKTNPLLLNRIPVEGDMSPALLAAYISPLGMWLSQQLFFALRLKQYLLNRFGR